MALDPFPPTDADLVAGCTKPEAITGIALATRVQLLGAEADRCAAVALSDRATMPLLQVDEGFRDCIINRTCRRLMGSRGYNRDAGADDEIAKLAADADAYLLLCAPSAGDGKRVTPQFVDSKQNAVVDGIVVDGHATSDWYARSRMDPDRTRRWPPS